MTSNSCVALSSDHIDRFGHVTYCTRPNKNSTLEAMLNSGMETMHNHQGTLRLFLPPEVQEEKVIQWFYGIDRHKKISAISVAPLFWLLFYPA